MTWVDGWAEGNGLVGAGASRLCGNISVPDAYNRRSYCSTYYRQ